MAQHKNKYVCECKSVKPFEIMKAVRMAGAETIIDIQNLTKASTGCGRCRSAVESILSDELEKCMKKGNQLKFDF